MDVPASGAPTAVPKRANRFRVLRAVAGVVVAVIALFVVVSAAGGLRDAATALRRVNGWWLVPAVALEAVSYAFLGLQLYRLVGRRDVLRRRDAAKLGLVMFGFGLLTPAAPAEGLAIVGTELHRRGLERRRALLALAFTQWFGTRIFYLLASLVVLAAVVSGHLAIRDVWPLVVAAGVVAATLVLTSHLARRPATAERAAVLLGRLQFWRPPVPVEQRRAAGATFHADAMGVVGSPGNRVRLVAISAGAVLTDAGCLWASLHAIGVTLPPDEIFLAVVAGSIATWLPLLPGGVGLVEAAVPAVLHHFGAPLDDALAATLIYRGLGTFLPALLGAGVVVRLSARRARRSEAERARRSGQPDREG